MQKKMVVLFPRCPYKLILNFKIFDLESQAFWIGSSPGFLLGRVSLFLGLLAECHSFCIYFLRKHSYRDIHTENRRDCSSFSIAFAQFAERPPWGAGIWTAGKRNTNWATLHTELLVYYHNTLKSYKKINKIKKNGGYVPLLGNRGNSRMFLNYSEVLLWRNENLLQQLLKWSFIHF